MIPFDNDYCSIDNTYSTYEPFRQWSLMLIENEYNYYQSNTCSIDVDVSTIKNDMSCFRSHSRFYMSNYQSLNQYVDEDIGSPSEMIYRTYKRRWFYLFVVCLAQISNAIVKR
jgi:hypothetical protein